MKSVNERYFLNLVSKNDEYFAETQLLLDEKPAKEGDLEGLKEEVKKLRDTIIVREKKAQSDIEKSRQYVSQLENLATRFESLYQSAKSADVPTKRNYLRDLNSLFAEATSLAYTAKEQNAAIIELKNITLTWMQKRIEFINMLITENSPTVTNTTRAAMEEGDKLYAMFKRQLQRTKEVISYEQESFSTQRHEGTEKTPRPLVEFLFLI